MPENYGFWLPVDRLADVACGFLTCRKRDRDGRAGAPAAPLTGD
jgi:hypothetical protein